MKRIYFQPEVTVAPVALQTIVLAGSPTPAPAGDQMNMNTDILTDDQW